MRKLPRTTLFVALVSLVGPARITAQTPPESDWNSVQALTLIDRGIDFRARAYVDSTMVNYSAEGRGFVYFLLDAPELDRQSLVRTDQVALEVYWRAPNQIRQRVVGLRQRQELPVRRLYYYLDRLTVVQDNYGQGIVIADGDNVNDVPHPVAAGAPAVYDYRIENSVTLRIPGIESPVEVYELQVRPKDASQPAMVGSIYLAGDTGALVRMSFTFTPAAYVDPRLDYIHVNLENGLWEGRHWLPYEQSLEIRREIPELDLPFGTVIRTRMQISGYQFNRDLPEWLFAGSNPVTFVPEAERRNFPFEDAIDSQRRLEGIDAPAEIDEIRDQARQVLRDRALSGLPTSRLGIRSASEVFAYNRADGVRIGAGLGFQPADLLGLRLHGGWAFGPSQPVGSLELQVRTQPAIRLESYFNRTRDAGRTETISETANTLSSLIPGGDFYDPFYASGGRLEANYRISESLDWSTWGTLERHRPAAQTTGFSVFDNSSIERDVRAVERGVGATLGLSFELDRTSPTGGWWGSAQGEIAHFDSDRRDFDSGLVGVDAGWSTSSSTRDASLEIEGNFATLLGSAPVQQLFLGGGRGTLPGYDYRVFGGQRYARVNALASADLLHPWFRGRVFGNVGWIGDAPSSGQLPDDWRLEESGGPRPSIGVGIGLFYDLLQIDIARGFGEFGRTELIVDLQPYFRDFL